MPEYEQSGSIEEGRRIITEFGYAEASRKPYEQVWQDVATLCCPNSISFTLKNTVGGEDRTQDQYDTLAPRSNKKFTALIMGLGTNPTTKWVQYALTSGAKPNEETSRWLQQKRDDVLFYANRDGFYRSASGVYGSLGLFGNAVQWIEERPIKAKGFNGFRFLTPSFSETYFCVDGNGDVSQFFRSVSMTAYQAVSYFGVSAPLPIKIMEAYGKNDVNSRFTFIFKCCPTDEENSRGSYDAYWVCREGEVLISEQEYPERPFVAPRMPVPNDEIYGRGIAVDNIADIRTANHLAKRHLQGADYSVLPPVAYNEGMDIDLKNRRPGRWYSVSDINGFKPDVAAIQPELFMSKYQACAEAIRDAWYVNQIEMPNNAEYMKATVALEIARQNRIVLGPIFAWLDGEYFKPAVDLMTRIYLRSQKDIPEQVKAEGGIKIEFIGPMAQAQQQVDLQAFRNGLTDMASIAQVNPSSLDYFDGDKAMEFVAQRNGIPLDLFRKKVEVQKMRSERAQVQAAQMQARLLTAGAQAAKLNAEAQATVQGA